MNHYGIIMADQIIKNYGKYSLLCDKSKTEVQYVRDNFSEEQALKVLAMDMDFSEKREA